MALDFPDAPNDGDESLQPNGVNYVWNAAKTRWEVISTDRDGDEAFDAKLAGYSSNGRHNPFLGDLDDILNNSGYTIAVGNVTNAPTDFSSFGFIITDMHNANDQRGNQIIYGYADDDEWKQWMRKRQGSIWG